MGGSMLMKKCCDLNTLRIVVGITMLALLLAGGANAANLTVCPSGCTYSSIQKAIKASSNGDTIFVKSGKYFENVKVNKKLTLHGIGNPVVEARGSGSAITLAANGITLEGFTATGAGDEGIKIFSNNNMLIGNNASNNYDGISMWYSSNNTLSNNSGSISLFSSSYNTMINNDISSNNGIHLSDSSNNTIYNNIFNTNNVHIVDSNINTWNTTRKSGTNIIGGAYLGGNFWANPNGTGFSQTCPDVNGDGICDKSYILDAKNIDYLPISMNFTKDKFLQKASAD